MQSGVIVTMLPFPDPSGALLLPGLVAPEICAHWLHLIQDRYAWLDAEALGTSGDYSPHSSSLRLRALPRIPVTEVWAALRRHPEFLSAVHHALGPQLSCLVEECWIRRQYAPGRYPPQHGPHSWHQDGALGYDFLALGQHAAPDPGLLQMLTCWVPLVNCGIEAPGLELIAGRQASLLTPAELTPAGIDARCANLGRWQPALAAGDALLFCGDLLHRTYSHGGMTRDRVSIELRFIDGAGPLPQRLKTKQLLKLG